MFYSMTAKCSSPVGVKQVQIITPPSLDGWYEVFVAIHGMFLPNMVLCIITTHFHNGLVCLTNIIPDILLFVHSPL